MLKTEPCWVINYQQFTKHAETGAGLHAESGFIKILPDGKHTTEIMLTHPFSVCEIYKNAVFNFDDNTLEAEALTEDCFQRGPTAKGKKITGVKRNYKIDSGKLVYDIQLAVDGGELKNHLHCVLEKQQD